ncbi:LANO_0F05600g1_1 [Lachancea nothofagi CBS 11611]|uniref:LANO_0F05600g1_1 n=1 Tax=Lachancea nothofagi CBS 11611 TaxID=1266666 RepID=A0A1G4K849_9SACH|nr:LANO_0F05600g1_1 [Lachancea nothofagi CBS 11611]
MAEQITHKRPVRIHIDRDKRKQLHDYYKLKEAHHRNGNIEQVEQTDASDATEEGDTSSSQSVSPVPGISQSTLAQLVHTHNALLSKKAEMNNTIKNTIYENYYDLIKVNELLRSVGDDGKDNLDQLKGVLKLLEE